MSIELTKNQKSIGMIKNLQSYAKNRDLFRKIIAACKQQFMRGKPIDKFPHYWALIPVVPERREPKKMIR